MTDGRAIRFRACFAASCLVAVLLAGCAVTEQRPVEQTSCAFLGKECSKLKPGAEGQAALRYVNPAAKWSRYDKVKIEPVTFWGGQGSKYSPEEQQALLDYCFQSLRKHLGEKFQMADKAGPGVMKIEVALTDVESATAGLRSVSMIVPQAHLLANIGYAATDKFPFVGGAQGEVRISDAVSGEVLAMAVDRRIGGGNVSTAFQWKWGDAENVMDAWSEQMAKRLKAWSSGTEKP